MTQKRLTCWKKGCKEPVTTPFTKFETSPDYLISCTAHVPKKANLDVDLYSHKKCEVYGCPNSFAGPAGDDLHRCPYCMNDYVRAREKEFDEDTKRCKKQKKSTKRQCNGFGKFNMGSDNTQHTNACTLPKLKEKLFTIADTKLDEQKTVSTTGAERKNVGKPRMSLISPYAMEGLAAVLTFGEKKYAAHNWAKGLSWSQTIDSLERHIADFKKGKDFDADSGLPTIDHVLCNVMFLAHFFHLRDRLYFAQDDRWKAEDEQCRRAIARLDEKHKS